MTVYTKLIMSVSLQNKGEGHVQPQQGPKLIDQRIETGFKTKQETSALFYLFVPPNFDITSRDTTVCHLANALLVIGRIQFSKTSTVAMLVPHFKPEGLNESTQ